MPTAPLTDPEFSKKYGPWALIVGGSDGLGAEFARHIAASGVNCILVARRLDVLETVAAELRADHGVEARTAVIDLEEDGAAAALAAATDDVDLGLVVFNAGADSSGSTFLGSPLEMWKRILRRNIDTLTEALYHFSTVLREKRRGGIVIVGSIAAMGGGARSGIYSATKGYALNLGESLWAELRSRGVDVLTLLFAIADTPTLRTVLERHDIPLESAHATPPAELARATLDAIAEGPTFVWGTDPDSPDSLMSPGRRRDRVNEVTKILDSFYGVPTDD